MYVNKLECVVKVSPYQVLDKRFLQTHFRHTIYDFDISFPYHRSHSSDVEFTIRFELI